MENTLCVLSRFSCVWLFTTLWTIAHQAPLSMGFSRQEYWSGLPCPSPGDLPSPGTDPASLCLLHWQVSSLPITPPATPDMAVIFLVLDAIWLFQFSIIFLCDSSLSRGEVRMEELCSAVTLFFSGMKNFLVSPSKCIFLSCLSPFCWWWFMWEAKCGPCYSIFLFWIQSFPQGSALFKKIIYLFTILFISGCAGSLLLCVGFL